MSTIKVNKIENTSTTAGGVEIDSSGHVQVDGLQMPTVGPLSNRNLIYNGAMAVSQRGTTETQSQYGGYPVCDRWRAQLDNASQTTFTQETSGGPSGFSNYFKWNVDSQDASVATASNVYLQQRLEGFDVQGLGYGTSSAKPLTISFYVKGNKTGTYVLELDNRNSSRHVAKTYTIDVADTWEFKTITFPADTTGTYSNNNGESLRVKWWLQAGTNFTSGTLATTWAAKSNPNSAVGQSVNLQTEAGANWNITGVQLEVGEKATPFEHRSFGDELARCQRYYQHYDGGSYRIYMSNVHRDTKLLPVRMRSNPTTTHTFNGTVNADNSGCVNGHVFSLDLQRSPAGSDGFIDVTDVLLKLDAEL